MRTYQLLPNKLPDSELISQLDQEQHVRKSYIKYLRDLQLHHNPNPSLNIQETRSESENVNNGVHGQLNAEKTGETIDLFAVT